MSCIDVKSHLDPLSGLFVAMLAIGGGWGRLAGMFVRYCASSVASTPAVSLPAYTIVGAAAMLGEVLLWNTMLARVVNGSVLDWCSVSELPHLACSAVMQEISFAVSAHVRTAGKVELRCCWRATDDLCEGTPTYILYD